MVIIKIHDKQDLVVEKWILGYLLVSTPDFVQTNKMI